MKMFMKFLLWKFAEKEALKTVNKFPWGDPLLRMNSQEIEAMEKRRVKEIKDKMGIN